MAISTNQKPTIYRNVYENTGPVMYQYIWCINRQVCHIFLIFILFSWLCCILSSDKYTTTLWSMCRGHHTSRTTYGTKAYIFAVLETLAGSRELNNENHRLFHCTVILRMHNLTKIIFQNDMIAQRGPTLLCKANNLQRHGVSILLRDTGAIWVIIILRSRSYLLALPDGTYAAHKRGRSDTLAPIRQHGSCSTMWLIIIT